MDTINMWADLSDSPTNTTNGLGATSVTAITTSDAAKIRKDAETAIENDSGNYSDVCFSITPQMDSDFRKAYEEGDTEKAAELVKQAAARWMGLSPLASKSVSIVNADAQHGFKNFAEAKRWAKENIVGEYENTEVGMVNVSKASIDKFLSQKAVEKSANFDVHLSTLKVIPSLIENSVIGEAHKDRKEDKNILDIVRLYGCVSIDGTPYRVKSTVKRYVNDNDKTKAYSYEVTEIELLEGEHGDGISELPHSSSNSIRAAKLLKGVDKSDGSGKIIPDDASKVVDENGEPMVVYHRTNATEIVNRKTGQKYDDLDWKEKDYWQDEATDEEWNDTWEERDFNVFNNSKARRSVELPAFFFAPKEYEDEGYGKRRIAAYLNISNPIVNPDFRSMGFDLGSRDGVGEDAMNYLIKQGYDGVIDTEDGKPYEYLVFSPSQIKSADPFTFDDNGELIPLSERFNNDNEDIRFSIDTDIESVNKKFNDELQQQIEGTLPAGHVYEMGMPSAYLRSTGVPNLPIRLQSSILNKKSNDPMHPYKLEEIRDLVKLIQKPLAIFSYGEKDKAQNLMIGISQSVDEGKQFLVGLSLSPTVNGKVLEINSVRNVFPKNYHDWIHWINQGKLLRVDDKENVKAIIDALRINPVDHISDNDLNSAAKVIENFKNPEIKDENISEGERFSAKLPDPTSEEAYEPDALTERFSVALGSNPASINYDEEKIVFGRWLTAKSQ